MWIVGPILPTLWKMTIPVSIPWLIEKMKRPELARVAGEAFSLITGVDLAYDDLEGDWPEGFETGPTENPEDEDVAVDAESESDFR